MPFDRSKYPKDWRSISDRIRKRSGGQCECDGECGLHNGQDLYYPQRRCVEKNKTKAVFSNGMVVLTVAHLNHKTMDNRDDNLKAMCQRCHLRYDTDLHVANAKITRSNRRKNERV